MSCRGRSVKADAFPRGKGDRPGRTRVLHADQVWRESEVDDFDLVKMLHVVRRDGELVLCINGSRRELLYFPIAALPGETAEALQGGDMEVVKSRLIDAGHDFLHNDFVLGRLLAEASPRG